MMAVLHILLLVAMALTLAIFVRETLAERKQRIDQMEFLPIDEGL